MERSARPKLEDYKNAFILFMGCAPTEVQAESFGDACIVEYKDEYYKVYHESDMIEFSEDFFKMPEGVLEIPLEIWLEVAEEVHVEPTFYRSLVGTLKDDQLQQLNLALNISLMCDRSPEAFWETLYNIDDYGVYSAAVIAASDVLGKWDLENSILTLMIADGLEYFNEMEDGIFETIEIKDGKPLPDNSDETGEVFYIFSVSPDFWGLN